MYGQMFMRDTGCVSNGKKLFIACGIVALDSLEEMQTQNESIYTLTEFKISNPVCVKKEATGMGLDQIIQSPFWRV
jgi:hypothetical protein